MSIDKFARAAPVRPPIMNRNTSPSAHKQAALYVVRVPYIFASNLKILIPVGTAMIIVAFVKHARVSTSIPTVNMWCARTTYPTNPVAVMAKIIPRFPNASFFSFFVANDVRDYYDSRVLKKITSLKIQYYVVSIIFGYVSLGISTELIETCLLPRVCSQRYKLHSPY